VSVETQELIIAICSIAYIVSSFIGAVLFTIVWRFTRQDRIEVIATGTNGRFMRLWKTVAFRNEYVALVMAMAFWGYAAVSTITLIRLLDLFTIPWEPGLITVFLLVLGNIAEMTIAAVLISARIQMNRVRD
jgi:hypothetical protein